MKGPHIVMSVASLIALVFTMGTCATLPYTFMFLRETSCWHDKSAEIWRTRRTDVPLDCDAWRDWAPFVEREPVKP